MGSQSKSTSSCPKVIDIGCGNNPREGAVGVDIRNYPAVDVQRDARDLPKEWEGKVERAYSSQMFEHLTGEQIAETLEEISRVLKPGGELLFEVPYGRAHNGDPTHKTRWYFKTILYYLPRGEVTRLGRDPDTFPDYFSDYDLDLELVDQNVTVWLDTTITLARPLSYALNKASSTVSTDKWDGLPLVGGIIGGELTVHLQKPI